MAAHVHGGVKQQQRSAWPCNFMEAHEKFGAAGNSPYLYGLPLVDGGEEGKDVKAVWSHVRGDDVQSHGSKHRFTCVLSHDASRGFGYWRYSNVLPPCVDSAKVFWRRTCPSPAFRSALRHSLNAR